MPTCHSCCCCCARCIVGAKGSGKSTLARVLAARLGYVTEVVHAYKDMTARDLLQRRGTDERGNTRWETTPLVQAALMGNDENTPTPAPGNCLTLTAAQARW